MANCVDPNIELKIKNTAFLSFGMDSTCMKWMPAAYSIFTVYNYVNKIVFLPYFEVSQLLGKLPHTKTRSY